MQNPFKYKNIVPGLISIDTFLNKINGFSFSENLNFYPLTTKLKYHYRVLVDDIVIPESYDFRNAYYYKYNNCWYYEKKLFWFLSLKFKFEPIINTFTVNKLYLKIPFQIGRIVPFGKHMADLINLDLFLNGQIIFQGAAVSYNDRNICIIGPSNNGKTSALAKIIEEYNGRVIADDLVIIDFTNNLTYPMAYKHKTIGTRAIQKRIHELSEVNRPIVEPVVITKIFFIRNANGQSNDNVEINDFTEFLYLCSILFFENRFINSYIFEERLLGDVINQIDNLRSINTDNCEFILVNNFNYDFLN